MLHNEPLNARLSLPLCDFESSVAFASNCQYSKIEWNVINTGTSMWEIVIRSNGV